MAFSDLIAALKRASDHPIDTLGEMATGQVQGIPELGERFVAGAQALGRRAFDREQKPLGEHYADALREIQAPRYEHQAAVRQQLADGRFEGDDGSITAFAKSPLGQEAANLGTNFVGGMGVKGAPRTHWTVGKERIPVAGSEARAAWDAERMAHTEADFGSAKEGYHYEPVDAPVEKVFGSHATPPKYPKAKGYREMAKGGDIPRGVAFEENGNYFILDGNGRLEAIHAEGGKTVPLFVRRQGAPSTPAAPAAAIATNQPQWSDAQLTAMIAALRKEKNPGFTFDPKTGTFLTRKDGGFAVAMHPEAGKVLDTPANLTPDALRSWLEGASATLDKDPANQVGGWVNREGKVGLDVSRRFTDRKAAVEAGRSRGEQAVYNNKAGKDLDLDYGDFRTAPQSAADIVRTAQLDPKARKPGMENLADSMRVMDDSTLRAASDLNLHIQKVKGGGFKGAPPTIRTMKQVLARRAELVEKALQGGEAGGGLWYENEGGARKAMNPKYAEEGTATSGINSNQASPAREIANDAEIRIARASGGPEKGKLTNPNFATQAENTVNVMEGMPVEDVGGLSLKTDTYRDTQKHMGKNVDGSPATREYIDPVIDTHMGTALGHEVPAGASTLTLGASQHAWGKGEIMAVANTIANDPAMLARWEAGVGKGMAPTPHRVQAAIWKIEKGGKVARKARITMKEALERLDASHESSFSKSAELFSPSEKLDPSVVDWKGGGNVDPLHEQLGLLQHPTANAAEARPVWGPESPTDLANSRAAAHGPYSFDEQEAIKALRGEYKLGRNGEPKLNKAGEKVGARFTRDEHLAAGAVDQEQALKDIAFVRQWAEGREHGGLEFRGREMPVNLPAEAMAKEGSGAATTQLIEVLRRNPGFERLLGPEAWTALERAPAARGDVMKGRALLKQGGLAAVLKHGPKGLLGLPALQLLGSDEDSQ